MSIKKENGRFVVTDKFGVVVAIKTTLDQAQAAATKAACELRSA